MPAGILKDLLTEIWSDECGNAHFGWRQLATWLPNDKELKHRLGEYLTIAFRHLETHELSHLPLSSNPPPEGAQYGLCAGKEARACCSMLPSKASSSQIWRRTVSLQNGHGTIVLRQISIRI